MPDDLRIVFYYYHALKLTSFGPEKYTSGDVSCICQKTFRGAHLDMSLLYPPKQIWREMANHAAFILQC